MLRQRLQLALVHVGVTITAVPIQGTLSRVMITELALPATLVALLAAFPYLFSPLQVAVGSFSDRHPLAGRRRTPYIVAGLVLCAVGLALSPIAAYAFAGSAVAGALWSALAFGAWGLGFTFSTVSYFSLASELSGEKGRARTVAVMFFLMIVAIILTSIVLSRLLGTYTEQALRRSFLEVAGAALVIGIAGVIGLEPRAAVGSPRTGVLAAERSPWKARWSALSGNGAALAFFVYLILMLAAILGQDILLAPFGAAAFAMPVRESTGITSVWGTFTLVAIAAAGLLEGRVPKRMFIRAGAVGAAAAYLLIIVAGQSGSRELFYSAVSLLGVATGLATVSNLSLMLDMTVPGRVGLFMGAWGMADAIARLCGGLVSGLARDLVTRAAGSSVTGYSVVFGLLLLMLLASLAILPRVDAPRFRELAR
jgi:MFS transporter, BCD family, chlorophyll transporter